MIGIARSAVVNVDAGVLRVRCGPVVIHPGPAEESTQAMSLAGLLRRLPGRLVHVRVHIPRVADPLPAEHAGAGYGMPGQVGLDGVSLAVYCSVT